MTHNRTVVSKLPEINSFRSGEKTIVETVPVCPKSVAVFVFVDRSQIRIALSLSPDARRFGPQKVSENVLPGRSGSVCNSLPVFGSQIEINGSSPPTASFELSGLKAKALIRRPPAGRSVNGRPSFAFQTRTVPLRPPTARSVPSGENAMARFPVSPISNVFCTVPVCASKI